MWDRINPIVLLLWLVLLHGQLLQVLGQNQPKNSIQIFTGSDFSGSSMTLDVTACVASLPAGFDNDISSISIPSGSEGCVHAYKNVNCLGEFIVVKKDTPMRALSFWHGFDDAVSSIGPCEDHCSPKYVEVPENNSSTFALLYEYTRFKGPMSEIEIKLGKCTGVPLKVKHRLSSIKVRGDNRCLELYNRWGCTGYSVQLRGNSPLYSRVGDWGLEDTAMSISYCGLNCLNTSSTVPRTQDSYTADQIASTNGLNNGTKVTLHDEANFLGNFKTVIFKDEQSCINITGEWEGEALSIDIHRGCFTIFELPDCNRAGKSLQLNYENIFSHTDLSRVDFDYKIRSIESCNRATYYRSLIPGKSGLEDSNLGGIVAVTVGVVLAFIVVGVVIVVLRLKKTDQSMKDILNEREIVEFLQGVDTPAFPNDNRDNSEGLAYMMPYQAEEYEIPRDLIEIDSQNILGSGHFSVVYKGLLKNRERGSDLGTAVAIKTTKPISGAEYLRSLLMEIKTMIYAGRHENIVELVGCCTQNLRNGELFVVTNVCENGSLEHFLKASRTSFVNLVEKGELVLEKLEQYENLGVSSPLERNKKFHTIHLIEWALKITEGMEYLASKKIIHGDLATRNILLDSEFQVKISDFGLSKRLYEYAQYVRTKQAPLPWRWLAIECLKNLEFSTQSDIWAFGVTLWEIFTLGNIPYPGLVWGDNFLHSLIDGLRLPKPQESTSDIYNWMVSCWRERPGDRPTFTDLKSNLQELLAENRPEYDILF